jgi:hypothetical protein
MYLYNVSVLDYVPRFIWDRPKGKQSNQSGSSCPAGTSTVYSQNTKKPITIFLSHLRPALKRERAKRKAEGTPDADSNGRPKPKAKGKAKNTPAAKAKK